MFVKSSMCLLAFYVVILPTAIGRVLKFSTMTAKLPICNFCNSVKFYFRYFEAMLSGVHIFVTVMSELWPRGSTYIWKDIGTLLSPVLSPFLRKFNPKVWVIAIY